MLYNKNANISWDLEEASLNKLVNFYVKLSENWKKSSTLSIIVTITQEQNDDTWSVRVYAFLIVCYSQKVQWLLICGCLDNAVSSSSNFANKTVILLYTEEMCNLPQSPNLSMFSHLENDNVIINTAPVWGNVYFLPHFWRRFI